MRYQYYKNVQLIVREVMQVILLYHVRLLSNSFVEITNNPAINVIMSA